MASAARCLSGALLAAAAVYWLDPASGRRRRARLRDRLASSVRSARHGLDVGGRDLAHRLDGVAAHVRHTLEGGEAADSVLAERVRACLGRAVSHPGAIDVETGDSRVILKGDVLAREYPALMHCVRGVRGVRSIEDRLSVHADARGVSALQGGRPRLLSRIDVLQESWAPATRLLIGSAGCALALFGLRRRTALGALAATAGGVSVIRSVTNRPLRSLAGAGQPPIEISKTLHIHAPVEAVFQTLSRFESYPLFTHSVRSVRMRANGRSHWTAAGPAGITVQWESETTRIEPDRLIAWRTVPRSPIRHSGVMRFEPVDGGTRLDIRMSYVPPAGILGQAVARLLGANPRIRLDEDMVRVKTFIETGKPPRDAASRTAAAGSAAGTDSPAPRSSERGDPPAVH